MATLGINWKQRIRKAWLVVVTQLTDRSLLTPEVRGSDPVIGEFFKNIYYCIEKTKIKEKEARKGKNLKYVLKLINLKNPL